jgi:hypothetical protein
MFVSSLCCCVNSRLPLIDMTRTTQCWRDSRVIGVIYYLDDAITCQRHTLILVIDGCRGVDKYLFTIVTASTECGIPVHENFDGEFKFNWVIIFKG